MSKQHPISDQHLIERIASGNTKPVTLLVEKWHVEFCHRAHYILKDADLAKDVVQKSWLSILGGLHALKEPRSFKTWAFRIIYNKSIDALRHRMKAMEHQNHLFYQEHLDVIEEEQTDQSQLKERLYKAIKRLPETQQEVVRLFYLQHCGLRDIAAILSISEGTVKSRLYHARERLKNELN